VHSKASWAGSICHILQYYCHTPSGQVSRAKPENYYLCRCY